MCDGMQWSKSGNGYAVVGFNLHAQRTENFFASGFSSVGNISTCGVDPQSRRKRMLPPVYTCTNNPCVIPCQQDQSCNCISHIASDAALSQQTINRMVVELPSCPPTRNQAIDDYRFIQVDNSNCFIWAFYEADGHGRSFTKQCCYQITGKYVIELVYIVT